jgi:hypothetical protein
MATLLAFVSAEVYPTHIYAEFLQSRLFPDLIFYSSASLPQELALSLGPTATEETNWSGNIAARLQEALENPAVHVITHREFEIVFEEMMGRRAEGEIVVEGTREVPIVTERKEWEWFYKNWQADIDPNAGSSLQSVEEAQASLHNIDEEGRTPTSFCTMRELPSTAQYRLYVLNMSPSPLPGVSLCYNGPETCLPLLPACTLPPGPSLLCYPQRPQGRVYLNLWAAEKRLCGLWA